MSAEYHTIYTVSQKTFPPLNSLQNYDSYIPRASIAARAVETKSKFITRERCLNEPLVLQDLVLSVYNVHMFL